ncbi:UDP-N-acetylglucosamine 2-epimerase [Neomegalonema sp.]|uniref:UDP-N-acetylglucosamine 2-epimerase n=1 Tax=Neomegalonema sp. TaxID=2039713 RepID=UPI002631AE57|nr:UDP-N-acetylglucosamine 2-epimerase [Neomegalonema sp.]MDD2867795.1 UDP-N-acetylglucosamine 2-epimerase [Neomegalonema sp.]
MRKDLLQRIRSLNPAALAFLARERGWTVDELQMRLQEPDRRKDPQSLLDEAVLRPARELDLKLQDILRSGLLPRDPETAMDQFKGDPEALRALRMAESFTGFHAFKGMFSPAAQPGSPELPAARSGVLVISAGDLSAEVRAGLGGGQPRTHHVAIQANKGDTRLRDIVVPHNSPIDHEAAHQAEAFGRRVADRIFKAASPELRGAWALSLADRMFGQFKRSLSLVDFQRQENCDKTLIVLEKGNWEHMFSLACALESAGGEVWVVWSAMEAPARQQLLSHWLRSGAATPLELLIRQQKLTPMGSAEEIWAAAALDRIAQAREPEPGFGGPLLNQGLLGELEDRILQEKCPLMMAGLGDPSYFAAMQALLAKMEDRGRQIVALDTNWAITSPANNALKGVCPGVALNASLAGMEAAAVEAEQEFLRFCEDLDPASLDPGAMMTIPRMYGVLRNVMSDCAIEMIAARRLLEKKPACFISLPGRAPEIRAATIIARENGVRSIDLQAFYISNHPRYKSSLADVYCAITTDQADLYKRHLDPPENQRIEVTGSLALDQRLSRVRGMSKEEARDKLNWAKDDRILLFGAQHGSGKEGRRILDLLIGMVETWPRSWRLVIKLHPREAQSVEQDMIDAISALGKRNQISVHRSESIYDLIVGSDVVVTQFSNIGLEAAVLGKPVLAVNFTENEYAVDLAEIGVAERMSTEGDLQERVKSLMSIYGVEYESTRRDDYFKMNEFLENGGSADRIMSIIDS